METNGFFVVVLGVNLLAVSKLYTGIIQVNDKAAKKIRTEIIFYSLIAFVEGPRRPTFGPSITLKPAVFKFSRIFLAQE